MDGTVHSNWVNIMAADALASLGYQGINSHDIDYVCKADSCLPWVWLANNYLHHGEASHKKIKMIIFLQDNSTGQEFSILILKK